MESDYTLSPIGEVIVDKFKIFKKIDEGAFGKIYLAYKLQQGSKKHHQSESVYVVKTEEHLQQKKSSLTNEANILSMLRGQKGFSQVYAFSQKNDRSYLVQQLFDKNMEQVLKQCRGLLSLKSVLMFLEQAFCRLEVLHGKSIIHRDIKPENFMIGFGHNKRTIYLIDFGLSQVLKKKSDSILLTNESNHSDQSKTGMVGSICFSSVSAQLGYEQSFRDDLESLAYTAIYFLKGQLPWSQIQGFNLNDTFMQVLSKKKKATPEEIGSFLPKEFTEMLLYARQLAPYKRPDYQLLKFMFRKLFLNQNYSLKSRFDWENQLSVRRESHSMKRQIQKVQSAHLTKSQSNSVRNVAFKSGPLSSDQEGPRRTEKCSIDNSLQSELSQPSDVSPQNSFLPQSKVESRGRTTMIESNSISSNFSLMPTSVSDQKDRQRELRNVDKIYNQIIPSLLTAASNLDWGQVPQKITLDSEIEVEDSILHFWEKCENDDGDQIDEQCPISNLIDKYSTSPINKNPALYA